MKTPPWMHYTLAHIQTHIVWGILHTIIFIIIISLTFISLSFYLFISLFNQYKKGHHNLLVNVFVCSRCCNKIPYTRGVFNNKIYFLTVLETRSPRSRCQNSWFLVRLLSLSCWYIFMSTHSLSSVHIHFWYPSFYRKINSLGLRSHQYVII